jgi:hypothetical protein
LAGAGSAGAIFARARSGLCSAAPPAAPGSVMRVQSPAMSPAGMSAVQRTTVVAPGGGGGGAPVVVKLQIGPVRDRFAAVFPTIFQ